MSRRDPADLAARLASKALQDATAVREFAANEQIADSILGFHAQQAVEKWLKAVMALRGVPQTRTHDIDRLVELLDGDGAELPHRRDLLDHLTQYAVPLRYEDLLDADPVDRAALVALIDDVERWAAAALGSSQSTSDAENS